VLAIQCSPKRCRAEDRVLMTPDLDFAYVQAYPSQFNREYRRFFGRPPIRDSKALRDGKVVAITTA
jgi:hypothetical protein